MSDEAPEDRADTGRDGTGEDGDDSSPDSGRDVTDEDGDDSSPDSGRDVTDEEGPQPAAPSDPGQSTDDGSMTLPEYEVNQYFPHQGKAANIPEEDYAKLRAEYGRIRAWIKTHPTYFRELQNSLNQARMGTTYDVYVTKSIRYAGIAMAAGIVLGLVFAWLLAALGAFSGLRSPIDLDGAVVEIIAANKELIAAIIAALVIGALVGLATFAGRWYYPSYRVSARRSSIDFMLPHAIVYMYALSYGGMNLIEVINRLADSEDAYGEVAKEFDAISRDVELFGNDLMTALRNARNITPSEHLERFLDDMVSVMDTGGDLSSFFEDASGTYLEQAQEEQEDFLETLSIFSEIYITAFVATPLFLIVILMVMSFLGAGSVAQMSGLIYVAFPLGMAAFLGLVIVLSSAYTYPRTQLKMPDLDPESDVTAADLAGDERFTAYYEAERWERARQFLRTPLAVIRKEPLWTLAITVPAAVVFLVAVLWSGTIDPSAIDAEPVRTTAGLFLYPFLILTVPLSFFHELKRSRENTIFSRIPDSLNVLSSANNMGIQFAESLQLLSQYTTGTLSKEFTITRRDLEWSGDLNRSLLGFANRINIPQLSRTVKIIADGVRSSGDLARVLSIAAQDTRDRYRIIRKRRRAMSSYIAVVIIGFLVYLMVIVFLDIGYLRPIEALAIDAAGNTIESPISLTNVPTDTYRMLFFHSVLIQAVGTGAIAGKLADDDVLSGLKYSIGLIALSLLVFTVITP